tara:strand:- start:248 stop:490 length:243 start_codon:yes stop_codon:yes gene_type:complete
MFELKQWRISKFGKQTSDINPKDLKTTKDYKDQLIYFMAVSTGLGSLCNCAVTILDARREFSGSAHRHVVCVKFLKLSRL